MVPTQTEGGGFTRDARPRLTPPGSCHQVRGAGAAIVRDPETGADVTPVSLLDSSKPAVMQGSHADYHDDLSPRSVHASGGCVLSSHRVY